MGPSPRPERRPPDPRRSLGAAGEALARRHLEERGLRIIASNYRTRRGEIDLVAADGDTLAFVEVKLKRGQGFGTPEEALTLAKRRKLVASAFAYLAEHGLDDDMTPWRIDLVAIELDRTGKLLRIDHYPNAVTGDTT